jgi:dipeptidyl aminopeptidase/acylaminoacyl peptidase
LRDLLPGVEGHVRDIAWRDADTVGVILDVGVESLLTEVDTATGRRRDRLTSNRGPGSPLLSSVRYSADGARAVLIGERPEHPRELFVLGEGDPVAARRTESNPWLDELPLAPQEVVRWTARDGLELEGLLLRPLSDAAGDPPPLLLMVHGGPEAHDRNGWLSSYSRPGQPAAALGFAVLYPNYRGSTGRGVAFSKLGQGDAAGAEFDDLVDAVGALVERGLVDGERVGINGGSYGGYATAWCATRHSERFRAGVMFVGISNKLSKGLTTEIPVEDKLVHTLFDPWTRWQYSLERSPIYFAERSRTALLIAGGTADSRVDPSQSLQLYRALKLIGKTPVRYVRYPGEGHGNANAAARDDYMRRLLRWMEHFVARGERSLPPWELEPPAGLLDDDESSDED